MATRLADPVVSSVASTPLPSAGGATAAPASTGAQAVFSQIIATLAQVGPRPKTTAEPLPKITAPPAGQQAPSTGQTLPKAAHQSGNAAAPPSKGPLKAPPSTGRDDAPQSGQAPDGAPPNPNLSADAAAATAPPIAASIPSQSIATGRVDNDPRETAVGSIAAPSAGRAEPPVAATTPPAAAAGASEIRSAAPFAPPDSAPSAATPQASTLSPSTAVTAAVGSATPATPIATTLAASPVARAITAHMPPPATTPAAQIAPPLISVAQSASGTQRLTIRLDPPELGSVQIRVEHPADAPMQVEINVQRPETLTLLMRDQPHLQHALDQAGVPAEGRTLSFHLDPQEQRGTSGDPESGHGRRTPMPAAQQMQADPDDPDDPAVGTRRWSRVALDITA